MLWEGPTMRGVLGQPSFRDEPLAEIGKQCLRSTTKSSSASRWTISSAWKISSAEIERLTEVRIDIEGVFARPAREGADKAYENCGKILPPRPERRAGKENRASDGTSGISIRTFVRCYSCAVRKDLTAVRREGTFDINDEREGR
jgi:hypothetical protein